MIQQYSAPEQSQPWRYATLLALKPFASVIYAEDDSNFGDMTNGIDAANMAALQFMVLKLLQDDDEMIRSGAAEIVREGLKLKRGVCQKRAMELVFDFIETRILSSDSLTPLKIYISRLTVDETEYGTLSRLNCGQSS